jgi:tRNA uridine 5-carboxymethylaminomethyl modification enzyme
MESRQKLAAVQPENLGQAGRITGVSPADIAVLLVWLRQKQEDGADKANIKE